MDGKKRLTVIIFSHAYLPFLGGAETAVKGITDAITDINFIMLTARYRGDLPRQERMGNVLVHRLGMGLPFDKFLLPIFAFVKFFRIRKDISGPYMFWTIMVSYGSIAAFFLKRMYPHIPLLLTLQEGDSEAHIRRGKLGLIALFWKWGVKSADRIQTISNYLKELAVSFGALPDKIEVVPNGVDIAMFQHPDPIEPEDIKSSFGITVDDKVIFTASRLVHKNAVDVLIQSMQFLKTPTKLVIAGGGEEEEKLKSLARALGLLDRVHFAGAVPYDMIPAYFSIAHVFVRPSRSEGLGIGFLEAMASGLPVVATRVGGIRDFLVDGETGLAVNVDDAADVAAKIDMLLADPVLRQKLIANGRKLVEEKYQWSKIAAEMSKIFDKLTFPSR